MKHNIYIIYIALELSYYKLNIIKTFKPNIYSVGIMLLRIITNIVEKQIVFSDKYICIKYLFKRINKIKYILL